MLKAELIYISKDNCSVCKFLYPKVTDMVKSFEFIDIITFNIDSNPEIIQKYSIFSAPVIIINYENKEVIRESGIISIDNLKKKIERFIEIIK